MTVDELEYALDRHSGLLGLSGSSGDLRTSSPGDGGDERAQFAFAVYVHRLRGLDRGHGRRHGGVDGLVFTGGAGEGPPGSSARGVRRPHLLGHRAGRAAQRAGR